MDENALVPGLEVDMGDIQETSEVGMKNNEETPNSPAIQPSIASQSDTNADVRMVVVDGIVVGPNVCFFISYCMLITINNFI